MTTMNTEKILVDSAPNSIEESKFQASTSSARLEKTNKKKLHRHIPEAVVHVKSSFRNIHVTVTEMSGGRVLKELKSSGGAYVKGSKKASSYVARSLAEDIAGKAVELYGVSRVYVKLLGPGPGREEVLRAFAKRLHVVQICDVTPLPHNGVRRKKRRRV